MQMLYNSDSYVVVQIEVPADDTAPERTRGGFEIVDKFSRKEIFIEGALAERFQRGVQELTGNSPDAERIDAFIADFTEGAQNPVVLH
ncbi:MAG: DUF3567 domain-containing protein [Pseudomonadota bacterium]|nr:DUF3567 domain-containing protein [Pseudomonadota bacterium]